MPILYLKETLRAKLLDLVQGKNTNILEVKSILEEAGDNIKYVVNGDEQNPTTVLHRAAEKGRKEISILSLLLESGAEVNATNNKGQTPLHRTGQLGRKDNAILLLKKGAEVNATDKDGNTALHLASRNNKIGTVRTLLANGADANVTNNSGNTALHLASMCNEANTALALLENGANANDANNSGNTALHLASAYDKTKAIIVLLKNGANISATDKNGQTPLHLASRNNKADTVLTLLENGADANAVDKNGNTALHLATDRGHTEIVRTLLENGANFDAADNKGNTALYYAVFHGRVETARLLLESGAIVYNKEMTIDNNGQQEKTTSLEQIRKLFPNIDDYLVPLEQGSTSFCLKEFQPLYAPAKSLAIKESESIKGSFANAINSSFFAGMKIDQTFSDSFAERIDRRAVHTLSVVNKALNEGLRGFKSLFTRNQNPFSLIGISFMSEYIYHRDFKPKNPGFVKRIENERIEQQKIAQEKAEQLKAEQEILQQKINEQKEILKQHIEQTKNKSWSDEELKRKIPSSEPTKRQKI